jgi:hypothetical protein
MVKIVARWHTSLTARATTVFLNANKINVMEIPPKSANVIENVWKMYGMN